MSSPLISTTFVSGYIPTQIQAGQTNGTIFRGENLWVRQGGRLENFKGILDIGETLSLGPSTGTISLTAGSNVATGTGTLFLSEFFPGNVFKVFDGVNMATVTVNTVPGNPSSDTSMTLLSPSPATVTNGVVTNYKGGPSSGTIYPLPTSGVVSLIAGSRTVTGAGTKFLSEFVQGSRFLIAGQLFVVGFVSSDVSMIITNTPTESLIGPALIPFMLVPLDVDRGAIVSGSAQFYRDGVMLAVGQGPLYYNGTQLFNFDARLTVYGVAVGVGRFNAGLTAGVAVNSATVNTGAGSKNMPPGTYSVRLARRRNQTKHVGNVGPITFFTMAANDTVTFDIPAPDVSQGQDSWVVYVSIPGTTVDQTDFQGKSGPWLALDIVTGGGPHTYEWAKAELTGAAEADFESDVPPHASFFAVISDTVVLESCHGNNGTNPGPFVRAARVRNPEAFPPEAISEVTPPEAIIGVLEGVGRLYLMTQNALHIATLTGQNDFPLTTRPYWKTGFSHQNSAAFVNGTIYGFSGGTPTRSRDEGAIGTEEHEFAARVRDIVASWRPERVFVGHDPINRAVVFIHSNDQKRSGKWVSVALCYMLETDSWSTPMVLSIPTGDFTVTGICTSAGKMFLHSGGHTYRWDANDGSTSISGYLATPYMDGGQPGFFKTVTKVELIARLQSGSMGLYRNNDYTGLTTSTSAAPTGSKDISLFSGIVDDLILESGDTLELQDNTDNLGLEGSGITTLDVAVYPWWKTNLKLAKTVAARIEWTWPGSGPLVSIDELTLHGEVITNAYH